MGGRQCGVVAVVAVCGALVLGGCSSGGDSPSAGQAKTSTGPSLAEHAPMSYDPCTQIPKSVTDSEQIELDQASGTDNAKAHGGIEWKGCGFVSTDGDGYTVSIRTTNLTIAALRAQHFPETQEFSVAGRNAISTRQFDDPAHIKDACTLNVEMRGGTIEFNVLNPASAKRTGDIDSCQIAKTLGGKVVPTMPANA
ncbi:MAG: DUF3558 domain-containing protein [Nocardia sp.]|nr:DUF3558 domain-containing protein [Nocardia sp.]